MDLVIRAAVVFLFIYLVTRVAGKRERITVEDIESEGRQQQVTDIADMRWALLETSGRISVIPASE